MPGAEMVSISARIRYRKIDGYKYELKYPLVVHLEEIRPAGELAIETTYISLSLTGDLVIREHYCWDGPSGPAIDTRNFMRGSLVHDALYQLIRMGLLPKSRKGDADQLLRRMCIEDGMSWVRAAWVYTAVKTFAGRACSLDPERDVEILLEAP